LKVIQASDEHEKLFGGEPRMILTPYEKEFIESNPVLSGLRHGRLKIEELLVDSLVVGVSAATLKEKWRKG
jgi:hypothetical protein